MQNKYKSKSNDKKIQTDLIKAATINTSSNVDRPRRDAEYIIDL